MKDMLISLLNRYLEQDEERAQHLKQIKGKLVRITVQEINFNLLLTVQDNHVEECPQADLASDVHIDVSLKALPEYLMGADADVLIKKGVVEIKGDAHIASVMQNTLKEIEIDWEEIISKYTGDAIAYQISKGAKALHAFGDRLRDNVRQDMRDYLQDNVQVAATRDEVEQFIKDVDVTRAQIDRLEARMNRLQSRD